MKYLEHPPMTGSVATSSRLGNERIQSQNVAMSRSEEDWFKVMFYTCNYLMVLLIFGLSIGLVCSQVNTICHSYCFINPPYV